VEDESKDHGVRNKSAGSHRALGFDTERCSILDIVSEQIPGTDCRKLGESLKKSFCLCALPNAWCANQNDARCF
jgi:hypothetical protein